MTVRRSHLTLANGLALVALLAVNCAAAGPSPSQTQVADAIYAGGDIVTVNDAQPSAEAVAVKDGRILAVGTRADVDKAHKGETTAMVDLAGKTLMPGSTATPPRTRAACSAPCIRTW